MSKGPSDHFGTRQPDSDAHGPLDPERISPSNYAPDFLQRLQKQNKVVPVREDWDRSKMPPGITWVIYPNGDLERVGYD